MSNPWHESKAIIVKGCARILWVLWWADQCACGSDSEHCRLEGDGDEDWDPSLDHTPNDQGGDLTEYAPDTPDDATEWANRLILAVECHGKRDIRDIYQEASRFAGHHKREPTPERFGECIAFTACGTGVSWRDEHPACGAEVPSLEYGGPDHYAAIDTRFWSKV